MIVAENTRRSASHLSLVMFLSCAVTHTTPCAFSTRWSNGGYAATAHCLVHLFTFVNPDSFFRLSFSVLANIASLLADIASRRERLSLVLSLVNKIEIMLLFKIGLCPCESVN